MRGPLLSEADLAGTNEGGRTPAQDRAQAQATAAARVADKREAERRASLSQMWPSSSPSSLPQAALGPGQLSSQLSQLSLQPQLQQQPLSPMATLVPSYETLDPRHHHNSLSSSGGNGGGIWQYPQAHPTDAKMEPKLADLWPRRASETIPSASWLEDYYNSAVADYDNPDEEEDSVFFPGQKSRHLSQNSNPAQTQTQANFVQHPSWLPTVFDDANAANSAAGHDILPQTIAARQSRLSYPSSSFHYLAAQQKAAQMMLQNERILRSQAYTPEQQLALLQLQQQRLIMKHQLQQQMGQQLGRGQMLHPQMHATAMTGREEFSQAAMAEATGSLNLADASSRRTTAVPLPQKDGSGLFSPTFQFQESPPSQLPPQNQTAAPAPPPSAPSAPSTAGPAPTKTFKPMQMVFREGRRASASSTSTSNSSGTGTGTANTATTAGTTDSLFSSDANIPTAVSVTAAARRASSSSATQYHQFCAPLFSSPSPTSLATLDGTAGTGLPLEEQVFRRQQGISLNYRGDIHNPHNRGDHIPAHLNTSLFLMGLPPQAAVGDLLRAVADLGPTGRVFAASVNPPDPSRRLPLAAAKISFFTRQQAERLKAQIDAQQLVMYDAGSGRPLTLRCAWNRDKKPPRQCVQASECRVLRIRGPADVVNFEALSAYFDEKFRYELQDVRVLSGPDAHGGAGSNRQSVSGLEQTMEWRFASFQSQAIAAKMALNQERKMVRVEYGRDPCEWGEC